MTVCCTEEEVLARSFPSPPYAAVSGCVATESDEIVNVATPLLSDPVPRVVAPSLKVTVPVAVDGDTVAVSVTEAPKVEGFSEEVNAVVVEAFVTACDSAEEVLATSLASPT